MFSSAIGPGPKGCHDFYIFQVSRRYCKRTDPQLGFFAPCLPRMALIPGLSPFVPCNLWMWVASSYEAASSQDMILGLSAWGVILRFEALTSSG